MELHHLPFNALAELLLLFVDDALDALTQLKLATSDVIIPDLNKPRMSGHEPLSVVRWCSSSIPVIAMNGNCESGLCFPGGVVVDAFFAKGRCHIEELLSTITNLVRATAAPAISHQSQPDPLQIPR